MGTSPCTVVRKRDEIRPPVGALRRARGLAHPMQRHARMSQPPWSFVIPLAAALLTSPPARAEQECRGTYACEGEGRCTPSRGWCIADTDADCRRSAMCIEQSACWARGGRCVAAEDAGLSPAQAETFSETCTGYGCSHDGLCAWVDDRCTVTDVTCRASHACRENGRCWALSATECGARSLADCREAPGCEEDGACSYDEMAHECTVPHRVKSIPMMTGGFLTIGLGGAALLTGIGVMIAAVSCTSSSGPVFPSTRCETDTATRNVGIGLMIGGVVGAAGIGVPLAVVGTRGSQAPISARVGPGRLDVTWRF